MLMMFSSIMADEKAVALVACYFCLLEMEDNQRGNTDKDGEDGFGSMKS